MGIAIGIVVVLAPRGRRRSLVTARRGATTGRLEPRDAQARRGRRWSAVADGAPAPADEPSVGRGDRARAAPGPTRHAARSSRAARRGARAARRGHAGGLRAGRPRGARRHPPAVLQPLDPRRPRPRPRRVRRRRRSRSSGRRRAAASAARSRSGPSPTSRPRSTTRTPSTTRRPRPTSSPYPKDDLPKAKKVAGLRRR